MTFKTDIAGKHFELRKGLSYKGTNLVEESDVGLLTIDAFITGGGYKKGAEKPFDGDYKPEYIAEPGDVLLAMTEQQEGLLASPLKVPEDLGGMAELVYSLDVAKVISRSGEISPEFLFNFLRVPLNRTRAAYGDTGTTVQRLPYEVIYEQRIPVPSPEEQGRINSFIAALDRKIELNVAMTGTLEKIAQSFFRSWFVNFDPVKAKMAGKKPVGVDDATDALFPDSMEDSGLGPIPKGWRIGALKDVLTNVKGMVKASALTESLPYVPIDKITSKSVLLKESSPGVEAKTSLVSFERNDILFGAMRPYFHKVCLAPFKGTTRTTTFVLRPIDTRFLMFSLFAVFQDDAIDFATNSSQGSTIPYATWSENFDSFQLVIPSAEVAKRFTEITSPLMELGYSLIKENQHLIALRDSLLPRLVSGELQIPEEMLVS